jgi:hypothetical protein
MFRKFQNIRTRGAPLTLKTLSLRRNADSAFRFWCMFLFFHPSKGKLTSTGNSLSVGLLNGSFRGLF